ncbi:MAG: exosortase T, partial [Candidatus Competibacteraceae bacterium]
PWHSTMGLMTLTLAALPLLLWARRGGSGAVPVPAISANPRSDLSRLLSIRPLTGLGFLALCGGIVTLPPQPVDVARPLPAPELPGYIAVYAAQPGMLTDQEQAYFTRYGGGAARAAYGPYGLLVVSTTAPLRHLHAPEECLAGAGHTVRYLGQTPGPIPSAMYHTTDPQGRVWRVTVTYVSERGERTTHVAEAVWRWLQAPGVTWRMIQRIAPWDLPVAAMESFDIAVWRALDLPSAPLPTHPQPLPVTL